MLCTAYYAGSVSNRGSRILSVQVTEKIGTHSFKQINHEPKILS